MESVPNEYLDAEQDLAREQNEKTTQYQKPMSDSYAQWVQDNRETLDKKYHALIGEFEDGDGGWIKLKDCQVMNEIGARFMVDIVSTTYLNKNAFMSKFKQDRILFKIKEFGKQLVQAMILNQKTWQLNSNYIDVIRSDMLNLIEIALNRADGANEKGFFAAQGAGFTWSGKKDGRFASIMSMLRGGGE